MGSARGSREGLCPRGSREGLRPRGADATPATSSIAQGRVGRPEGKWQPKMATKPSEGDRCGKKGKKRKKKVVRTAGGGGGARGLRTARPVHGATPVGVSSRRRRARRPPAPARPGGARSAGKGACDVLAHARQPLRRRGTVAVERCRDVRYLAPRDGLVSLDPEGLLSVWLVRLTC